MSKNKHDARDAIRAADIELQHALTELDTWWEGKTDAAQRTYFKTLKQASKVLHKATEPYQAEYDERLAKINKAYCKALDKVER